MAGARQQWTTPPTWVKPLASAMPYRALSDAESQATPIRTEPRVDPDWPTVERFLNSGDPRTAEFLHEVAQRLTDKMGPELARRACATAGPFWRAMCCEVWRQRYTAFEATG